MDRDDEFLSGMACVAQRHMTSNLMVAVPTRSSKSADQSIPGKIPGEVAHTGTTTVASVITLSS